MTSGGKRVLRFAQDDKQVSCRQQDLQASEFDCWAID